MKERDTPLKLVRMWPKMLPGCYEMLDNLRNAKAENVIWWPDYCMLPINAAFACLIGTGHTSEEAAAGAAELTACWMWRQNKVIYRFDRELMESLREQAKDLTDTDVLPTELLLHLPYPCIYIKCPGLLDHIDGFFAWVEWDTNRNAAELRVQIVFDTMDQSLPMVMHLVPGGTVGDCIQDTLDTTKELSGQDIPLEEAGFETIFTAAQMILYITAENADIVDEPVPVKPVRKPGNVIQLVQDKAGEVKAWDVGVRVGAALRKARTRYEKTGETGAGGRKRSHARRGHWHHYWTGPKDGERKLILKWTAPTVIHPEDGMEDNVVVFPVK